jgi:hypothetical protein
MADAGHYFSGDLQLGATGDLLAVDGLLESNQRILRRLLTNKKDYIWQPGYGAGLPSRVGQPLNEPEMDSLIRSQMYLEESVSQNPAPQILTDPIANGIDVQISYVELETSKPATLSFQVTP